MGKKKNKLDPSWKKRKEKEKKIVVVLCVSYHAQS